MRELMKRLMGGVLLSEKERVILSLLANGDELFGLQIVQLSEGAISKGTLYVTVGRMVEKGFVVSRQEAPREGALGPPRRFYQITGVGREALARVEALEVRLAGEGQS